MVLSAKTEVRLDGVAWYQFIAKTPQFAGESIFVLARILAKLCECLGVVVKYVSSVIETFVKSVVNIAF